MKAPPPNAYFSALVAGQAAGLTMLVVAMLLSLGMGRSPWFPLQLMTALMVGPEPLEKASADNLLPGLIAHQLGPTIVWSRACGLLVAYKEAAWRLPQAVLAGTSIGMFALVTDVYIFMPQVQRHLHARDLWSEHMTTAGSWLTHLAFGVAIGYFFWRFQERPPAIRTT